MREDRGRRAHCQFLEGDRIEEAADMEKVSTSVSTTDMTTNEAVNASMSKAAMMTDTSTNEVAGTPCGRNTVTGGRASIGAFAML